MSARTNHPPGPGYRVRLLAQQRPSSAAIDGVMNERTIRGVKRQAETDRRARPPRVREALFIDAHL